MTECEDGEHGRAAAVRRRGGARGAGAGGLAARAAAEPHRGGGERALAQLPAGPRAARGRCEQEPQRQQQLQCCCGVAGAGNHTDLWAEMDSATLGLSTARSDLII